jgi:hypothetical protein
MVVTAPSVLVFDVNETLLDIDVNETLLDIESMAPFFERIFGDPRVLREWFGQLVMYSMTATLSGHYVDYFTLGQGLLRMFADIHHVNITDDDVRRVKEGMLTMPAHPDGMMVAAHAWDTLGAQSAGFNSALVTRPGNAPLPIHGLPQPNLLASDLRQLARQLIAA